MTYDGTRRARILLVAWILGLSSCRQDHSTEAAKGRTLPASAVFRGGTSHEGVADDPGPGQLRWVAWRFQSGAPIRSSPVLADGVLYFGNSNGRFHAVAATDGVERWHIDVESPIAGAAAVGGDLVIFIDRANRIHAVRRRGGRPVWQHAGGADLPLPWGHEGWDYLLASPTVAGDLVLAGTGDGKLYALSVASGRERWHYQTGGRIRSAAAVKDGVVYFGSGDGIVHAVRLATGEPIWKATTDGASLDAAAAGFDRRQIYSSPAVVDSVVYIGSRDAGDYAFHVRTGQRLWVHREGTAWVMSSPAVRNGRLLTARSSGGAIYALDAASGKRLWQAKADGMVYSSPTVGGETVYLGSGDRAVYAIDVASGTVRWRYRTGGQVYGTPVIDGNRLYIGSDDGNLYAFEGDNGQRPHLAVYWDDTLRTKSFWGASDGHRRVADYFEYVGYEVLDATALIAFLDARINDRAPSVLVVATDALPPAALGRAPPSRSDSADNGVTAPLLRRYLDAHGKVVWMGFPPEVLVRDAGGRVTGIDRDRPSALLGIAHHGWDTDEHWMKVTDAGRTWGLHENWVGMPGVAVTEPVIPLAVDELGRAGAWAKSFGGPTGTGYVVVPMGVDRRHLEQLRDVAEYGVLRRPGG